MAGIILKNDPRHPSHPQYDALSKARAVIEKSAAEHVPEETAKLAAEKSTVEPAQRTNRQPNNR